MPGEEKAEAEKEEEVGAGAGAEGVKEGAKEEEEKDPSVLYLNTLSEEERSKWVLARVVNGRKIFEKRGWRGKTGFGDLEVLGYELAPRAKPPVFEFDEDF